MVGRGMLEMKMEDTVQQSSLHSNINVRTGTHSSDDCNFTRGYGVCGGRQKVSESNPTRVFNSEAGRKESRKPSCWF